MPLPISGNQLKKLTRRLRDGTAEPADRDALSEVLLHYKDVLDQAHADVEQLCTDMPHAQPMAPRVKTLKTTLEKLDRQPELRSIAQIRDIAGLRIVVLGTRQQQDDVVAQVAQLFPARTPKIIDRRAEPKQGYRAVHVEVRRDDVLIEVQVRTEFQHEWAELFERAADKLGRGLRYGEPVAGVEPTTIGGKLVALLFKLADYIDWTEVHQDWGADDWPEKYLDLKRLIADVGNAIGQIP